MRAWILGLSASSKMMCAGLAVSLGWFALSGCPCTKEEQHPDAWVACISGQPILLQYNGDKVVKAENQPDFNASDWKCEHTNSPKRKNSNAPDYPVYTRNGPLPDARPHAANSNPPSAFLTQLLLSLPFVPPVTPGAPAGCDPSFPDVLQVDHEIALVTRISTCPFAIKSKIPVVSRPLQIVITPDGATALVTSFDNAVNFINLATDKVTYTLNTDFSINPNGLAISPDGSRAYITSFNTDNPVVVTINTASHAIIGTVRVGAYPQGAILTPDGSQLWVTFPFGQGVYVVDTLSNTVATVVSVDQSTDVAFNSTGTTAYITSGATSPGTVQVVDTATYKVTGSYPVGIGPGDIAMSHGDQTLVVNNYEGNSVTVIDLITDTVHTASFGSSPEGIAFVR